MPKKISKEIQEEITRLYDDGRGMSLMRIARKIGISYNSIYGMT